MPEAETSYDIFISYRTTHSDWVETLAYNLKNQGYSLFLDKWQLIPGQSFPKQIHQAIKNSKSAILIATLDAADSGWVQQELDLMQVRARNNEGFFFIPVVMGEFPDMPFIETLQAVDFADSEVKSYRQAFHKLLCGLRQQPPGANGMFNGELQLPAVQPNTGQQPMTKIEQSFIDKVFDSLRYGMPIIILAQADTHTQAYANALRTKAEIEYGSKNVLHIYPPNSSRADSAAYFGRLARQCHFANDIQESWQWAEAMEDKLIQGQDVFLLVTGFENGAQESRAELAGEMRQLHERFTTFHSVIMGSEKLAALKYAQGSMSLLNIAEEFLIPRLNHDDLLILFQQLYPELELSPEQFQKIAAFTGCHPRLLHACLQQGADSEQAAQKLLLDSPLPAQLFSRFKDEQDSLNLCDFLNTQRPGKYEPWPADKLLRRLYWHNLITREGQDFIWRCDFIRNSGKGLLQC